MNKNYYTKEKDIETISSELKTNDSNRAICTSNQKDNWVYIQLDR